MKRVGIAVLIAVSALGAIDRSVAQACSTAIVGLDGLLESLADEEDTTFAGVVEVGVVHVWPENDTYRAASAASPLIGWGVIPMMDIQVNGGALVGPTTTTSCGSDTARRVGDSWYMAVYASRPGRPVLISPGNLSQDHFDAFSERFGEPTAAILPVFSPSHPSGSAPSGDAQSTQPASEVVPDSGALLPAVIVGFALLVGALVAMLSLRSRRSRPEV